MAKTEIKAAASLDTTRFQRSLARTQTAVNRFAKNVMARFGAIASVAGLGMVSRAAINLGSKISDMAVQLNIGTTAFQALTFAARKAGVKTETLSRALRNVQLRTEQAIQGNKSYSDAFEQLGINLQEFKNLKTEEKLEAIAKAQANATDKAAAYNAVSRILGEKAGPALQEVLKELAGPQGYGGLEAAAERAGQVMSEETVAKMDASADKIVLFKNKMTILTAEILTNGAPILAMFGNAFRLVADYVGVSAAYFVSFGKTVGTVLKAVIDPAINQMKALGLAIKAVGQFAKRDFKGASNSIKQAEGQVKKTFDAIKKMPDALKGAFSTMVSEQKTVLEVLADSFESRTEDIVHNIKEIKGEVKEANKEIKKADAGVAGQMGTSNGGGATGADKSTDSTEGAGGGSIAGGDLNADGITTGREMRAKERADRAAASAKRRAYTSAVVKGNLEASARTIQPSEVKPRTTELSMAQSLKAIEREMTKTTTQ